MRKAFICTCTYGPLVFVLEFVSTLDCIQLYSAQLHHLFWSSDVTSSFFASQCLNMRMLSTVKKMESM
jgi:hypothetical protein